MVHRRRRRGRPFVHLLDIDVAQTCQCLVFDRQPGIAVDAVPRVEGEADFGDALPISSAQFGADDLADAHAPDSDVGAVAQSGYVGEVGGVAVQLRVHGLTDHVDDQDQQNDSDHGGDAETP